MSAVTRYPVALPSVGQIHACMMSLRPDERQGAAWRGIAWCEGIMAHGATGRAHGMSPAPDDWAIRQADHLTGALLVHLFMSNDDYWSPVNSREVERLIVRNYVRPSDTATREILRRMFR